MKAHRLAMLCVGAAPLILSGPAPAEFVGIQVRGVDNPFGFYVERVYAVFDRPGEDEMFTVFGTPEVPLTVTIIGGSFYQTPNVGSDLAPSAFFVGLFPSLAFDTFVTIGVKSVGEPNGQPVNETTLLADWPGFGLSELTTTTSGWSVPSGSPQADPFDSVNAFPGDSRVLIGQFSSTNFDNTSMLIQYRSNGVIEESLVEFIFGNIRCTDDCDCIDHPCFGTRICKDAFCLQQSYPFPDCNWNTVLDSCDIDWGTSQDLNGNGVPDECDPPCPWDCADGDGHVGIAEFLAVVGTWGQVGVACDFSGDAGVGIDEFLEIIGFWGPCP